METVFLPASGATAEFVSPATVVSGRGSSALVARVLSSRLHLPDGASVLVAVDDVVAGAGLLGSMLDALNAGYRVTVVGGFGAEPDDDRIDRAAARAREVRADVVVAVGGGSVLDAAKMVALLLRNDGGAADWLGPVAPPGGVAPLVMVPTTCGTGSEATRAAMVTVAGAKRISATPGYVGTAVVLDPALLDGLPGRIVAITGMDALSHAAESLMSTDRSPMTVHHARAAIALLVGNLEAACHGDVEARAACLWASHLSGQALNAGVLLGHSLAYCVAHERSVPHGVSSGLALPYCIAFNAGGLEPDCARTLARALSSGRGDDLLDAAEAVRALLGRLELPGTLAELGIGAEADDRIAQRCAAEYPRANNPTPMTVDALRRLVPAMRTGDLGAAFAAGSTETATAGSRTGLG
ncbi:iron-containing alcohol dehydrogenase family protein [Plantactinospora sp. BB1]|uniref:iron-containing alcohol dehydrogenase family protein n=1 Tax=Plantactinospora sp. BB1 TaxID=2071627 RepID=UPI000D16DE98|nr:iron-containing alcohol dehydrogenase [Plantactinospora sp. BB1]AVT37784.1 alcohol dehydrogenase [Plantactinospora sp. BB1]